eukprot:8802452-Lingulodinium_polyedra.AAC.1
MPMQGADPTHVLPSLDHIPQIDFNFSRPRWRESTAMFCTVVGHVTLNGVATLSAERGQVWLRRVEMADPA